jgi:outer membrane autotransporter protein
LRLTMNRQAKSADRASDIRRCLIFGAALATSAFLGSYGGYVPPAYADCSLSDGSYTCSGTVTTTQNLTGASVSVTTTPDFNITTSSDNAFTLTSAGGIEMLVDKASVITGAVNGIEATTTAGSGDIAIAAYGAVEGAAGNGISVTNNGTGGVFISNIDENGSIGKVIGTAAGISVSSQGEGLVIDAADVSGGTDGITAVQEGSGNLSIIAYGTVDGEATGKVVGATGVGISAELSTGANLSILSYDVSGGTDGISAVLGIDGTGELSITTLGTVSGGSGAGIRAQNDSMLPTSTTSITVGAGSIVSGATAGIALQSTSGRAAIVTNAGAISGATGILATGGPTTISNTGDITGSNGTAINLIGTTGPNTINQQGGTITGEIALSDAGDQVKVTGGRIDGDIVGQGAGSVTFDLGTGSFTSSGAISDVDEIAVSSGQVRLDGTLHSDRLTVNGGSLVLNGDATASGGATVSAGTLVVGAETHADAQLANRVTVNDGGMLGGIGTIGGLDVASGGTVAPGNGDAIGTLKVTGTVGFGAGAIYQVKANASQADRIEATGAATLSGGTVAVIAQGTGFLPQTTYTILKAGSLTGTFARVSSNFAFLTPTLGYAADEVRLTLTLAEEPGGDGNGNAGGDGNNGNTGSNGNTGGAGGGNGASGNGGSGGKPIAFSSVALTANQAQVADAVQSLGLGQPLYNAVVGQTVEGARQAFAALSGEVYASVASVLLGGGGNVQSAVSDRLRQGLAPAYAPPPQSAARQAVVKGPLAAVVVPEAPYLYTLWGEGFGAWRRQGGDGNAAGFDTSVGGFVLGADAPIGDAFRIGVAGGYSRASIDGRAGATADLDSYYAALYGGGQWGSLGLRVGAVYGRHDLDTKRSVVFPGFAETLEGSRDATTMQAFGELGYRVTVGAFAFEPFAGLAYVNLATDAFAEHGGAAGLVGLSSDDGVAFTSLGIRAAQRWELSDATAFTLRGEAGWQRAFGDTKPISTFVFAGGSLPFSAAGVPIARDALILKAGADFDIGADVSLGVSYSAQLAKGVQDQQIKGALTVRF